VWMLAEFVHAFTISALAAVVFLGGWRGPLVDQYPLLGAIYFLTKTYVVYMVLLWIRVTLPRVRIDHMNALNWKFLVPLSLTVLVVTALVGKAVPADVSVGGRAVVLFLSNVALAVVSIRLLTGFSRKLQAAEQASIDTSGAGG